MTAIAGTVAEKLYQKRQEAGGLPKFPSATGFSDESFSRDRQIDIKAVYRVRRG